ncbi:MAG: tributyrin esterase [Anaerolineae bacterium]|nr:tributyrin esterase [Anaerolineae bacterium]
MAIAEGVRELVARGRDLRAVNAELKQAVSQGPVVIQHAEHLHGLAAGLSCGEVVIDGNAGDYLGVLNDGASIRVRGNAGRYLADNMTRGTVVVDGDCGYGAGQYCYGGTIVIRGSAGDLTAVMNKGATILIAGDVGHEVATYMLGGDVVILGDAGAGLGNYLIRGALYVGGTWRSLGHNAVQAELGVDDAQKLRTWFERFGIAGDVLSLKKIVSLSERPFYKAR